MLVAYLRGLLKPSLSYGLRSSIFEELRLEAMLAQIQAENFHLTILSDSSMMAVLTDESKQSTMRRIGRQLGRRHQLMMGDVYDQANARRASHQTSQGTISLVQLYHLCVQEGILSAVDKLSTLTDEENAE